MNGPRVFGRPRLRAAIALGLLASACGSHTELRHAILRTAPPVSTPALVYVEGQTPEVEFYELGLVQAIGFGGDANPEDLVRALTKMAAELGCQAIVRVGIDLGQMRAHASGVCVRFVGAPPSGTPRTRAGELVRPREAVSPRRAAPLPRPEQNPSDLSPETTN